MIEHYCVCLNSRCKALWVGLCLEFWRVEKHIPCVECGRAMLISGMKREPVVDVGA